MFANTIGNYIMYYSALTVSSDLMIRRFGCNDLPKA